MEYFFELSKYTIALHTLVELKRLQFNFNVYYTLHNTIKFIYLCVKIKFYCTSCNHDLVFLCYETLFIYNNYYDYTLSKSQNTKIQML